MLYQINLVRDRVVPKNLGLKRAVIGGSVIGAMMLLTIVVAFLGLRLEPEIKKHQEQLANAQQTLEGLQKQASRTDKIDKEKQQAQRNKAKLVALWTSPINFGVIYEMVELLANNWAGNAPYDPKQIVIRKCEFTAGQNDNRVRVIAMLQKQETYDSVATYLKSILGDPDKPNEDPTDLRRRASVGMIEFQERSFEGLVNEGNLEGANRPPRGGQFLVFELPPDNDFFYSQHARLYETEEDDNRR